MCPISLLTRNFGHSLWKLIVVHQARIWSDPAFGHPGVFPPTLLLRATVFRSQVAQRERCGSGDQEADRPAIERQQRSQCDDVGGCSPSVSCLQFKGPPGFPHTFGVLPRSTRPTLPLQRDRLLVPSFLNKTAFANVRSGNPPAFHDFRHTFAVKRLNLWVQEGKDLNACLPYLSIYLGHAHLVATDYYLHFVPNLFPAVQAENAGEMRSLDPGGEP